MLYEEFILLFPVAVWGKSYKYHSQLQWGIAAFSFGEE